MTEEQLSSNHPPLPPTTEEDRFSWLRLLRSRKVGPATFRRLLREHGSAQNALAALPEMARAAGIEGYEICPPGVIEAELKAAKAAKARLLCLGSADFPAALSDLNDAPPMLWAIGDVSLLQKPAVAMVGARNCSSLGARMARGLATDLGSKGYVIVSGLARGIDTAAHIATLTSGTIAVMAGGVDVVYPVENTELAHDIASNGLRVSEQPMGVTPQARHFPRRNRIISGLAQAVVVVEAAAKSGSLITARDALDQGREVLAVPGHPFDARAAGCNLLIRDGAILVRSAEDVVEALPHKDNLPSHRPQQPPTPVAHPAQDLHIQILERLGPSPIAEDQLLRDIAASAGELGPALVDLELDGRIQRQPGGLLSLAG
ncbi:MULTISPECIES: DNA-processing protein DprA [unclassified Ruegeria]|uniref:DNA-processing protein DprA n=1 Tax=unclassified Ruegeria TaxID=2625375 RepID=UPI0014878234|nr:MULTISPECIES: DNA-processing protein DprA [unclassified Ruegeria]NOD35181.1 DNA-protecting protein DprA [Ruegeria sp. HKCCD7296]NOE33581.1 DNA-protecting protein DprA [Ruegeria sp. HKCCD7318]NOE42271.1 DNA-protecting protein DprA [Ruegeria sp. HKCCD7319]